MRRGSGSGQVEGGSAVCAKLRLWLPRAVATGEARRLRVEEFGCQALADLEPHALGLTYWFDPVSEGKPYPVTIRFTGSRIGTKGKPGRRDRFDVLETIDGVVPGSGPIAVSSRVHNITPGDWRITATPVRAARPSSGRSTSPNARPAKAMCSGRTVFAPFVNILAPGARLGIWPALVALGALVGLSVQAVLAAHTDLPVAPVTALSLVASLVGLVGAKLYYVSGHLVKGDLGKGLNRLTGGMCIQGFVLGAVGTLVVGAGVVDLAVGPLLDVTAPGLLFGMTVGRFGCFFGGCCAGRPTASRWGLWSSDRRLGMRRIPTQLYESAVALVIGLAALAIVWMRPPQPSVVVFVGAIAAYTLARQLLFPLRAGPRHTSHGRAVTVALTALVLVFAIAMAIVGR